VHPEKTSIRTIASRWQTERYSDNQSSLSLYTSTNNTLWGKEALGMASAFLGKYASITAVDLILQKKLDFRNFYESNLAEARFDSLLFY